MRKALFFLLLCSLVLTTKAEVIIPLNNGSVVYYLGASCHEFEFIVLDTNCIEGEFILKGMGSRKKWIKEHYTPEASLFRIRKGHIDKVDGIMKLYYKKWLFGKKIYLGLRSTGSRKFALMDFKTQGLYL